MFNNIFHFSSYCLSVCLLACLLHCMGCMCKRLCLQPWICACACAIVVVAGAALLIQFPLVYFAECLLISKFTAYSTAMLTEMMAEPLFK